MQSPTKEEVAALGGMLRQGVTTSRATLLIVLLSRDTASRQMGRLAADLSVSIPRVSMLGDTLVRQGLVDRVVPASDQRKVALALTQLGYEAARAHLQALRGFCGACVAAREPQTPGAP